MIINNLDQIMTLVAGRKVLIFDFDGVIADSNDIKTEAFSELYKPFGSEIVNKVILHHKNNGGISRFEKFKFYHRSYLGKVINQNQVDEMSATFSDIVLERVISAPEINSAELFLKKSCKEKKICSINSATPEIEIQQIIKLRQLDKYFSKVFGSPSTKSENINKILEYCKSSSKEALFFGDSESDLMAANKNKVDFIGVGKGILSSLISSNEIYYHIDDFAKISK